jgi:hypothetical protein
MSALGTQDVATVATPAPIRLQVKWLALVGGLTGMVLGAAMAVTFYPHLPGGRARAKIAVVDLASVVRKNQEAAVSQLANGAADQLTRDAAFASAQGFGKRLDAEVIELSRECRCILLMREAVVAGDVEDLTPALLSRLAKR